MCMHVYVYDTGPGEAHICTRVYMKVCSRACLLANEGDVGSIPGSRRPLEKGMAMHSSVPTWEIPWTVEPGWPQSMGLQRVGRDLASEQQRQFVLDFSAT